MFKSFNYANLNRLFLFDELSKTAPSSPSRNKPKSRSRSRVHNTNGDGEEKEVIRVKVKMTKEEASRLMSKCKKGGVLEFKDAAQELMQIPVNRVSVVSSRVAIAGRGCVLGTIHEEI